jgi:chemotaxis protein MotB
MSSQPTPIFIIRKKSSHGDHHGGAWKVAYADFVTAMMALFIVLWLMSASQDVQKAIAGYFRDPKGFGTQTGSSMGGSGEALTISKDHMDLLKSKLEQAVRQTPEFEKLKNYVQMTITGEGLRIELMESDKGMFFENGHPIPTPLGKEVLIQLAKELGKLKNPILIEGHTDSKPYESESYSNWELSADRANSARRIMQEDGLRPDQVSQVRGFADQQLRIPGDPEDPSNRRVSIIVRYPQIAELPKSTKPGADVQSGSKIPSSSPIEPYPNAQREARAGRH